LKRVAEGSKGLFG